MDSLSNGSRKCPRQLESRFSHDATASTALVRSFDDMARPALRTCWATTKSKQPLQRSAGPEAMNHHMAICANYG